MDLWDTHCHLFHEYYENLDLVMKEADEAQVHHYIISGCDSKSNDEVINFIHQNPNCYGVVGFHPEEVLTVSDEDIIFLENALVYPKILGIGEIGLDYHYSKDYKKEQIVLFEKQLKIAEKYHLPVVIHSRDATEDTIATLKKYQVTGVIHSFSGSLETARTYIGMGFKLGINGVVTFKNSKLKDILKEIFPYIVLETDSPYLTPHPYRGTQNSPKFIRNIAEFIANELHISVSQVEKVTNQNIIEIFDKLS